ncbi:MAG: OmpA family protein [Chitinophagaceae bacterium]|nr:OmpA family protein [Chitinophagaceae bacterium]
MKKIFVLTAVLFSFASLHAQFVYDYLKAADDYFQKGDYASAAEYYEKYMGGDKTGKDKEFKPYTPQNSSKKTAAAAVNKEQAMYNLAECYRLLNYPSKAEPQYKEVMVANKKQFPLAQYHYASQLRALGKYAEAEQNFKTFLAAYPANDEYKKNAERELKNLQFIQAELVKKDLKYYTINKAGGEVNAKGASYAPAWLNSNTLLFTSTRPQDTTAKTMVYTNRIYQAVYDAGTLASISLATIPQEKGMQQGVVTVTPDGNTMYLTKWGISGDKKSAAIYSSSKTNDGWSEPVKLGESINANGANTQQPFVTADGKYLLFSSNRTGGQGGYDIWYAPLENGTAGTPVNMGAAINTSYDEQAPAYHEASASLIFSSNGRVGMGGYDFFRSKGNIGNWTEPVNMGYPVNSVKDDIYMVSRGSAKNVLENVMLSSDRDAVCCLELFALQKVRPLRQLSGRVLSCDPSKPLSGATVTIVDPASNKTIYTKEVGADGTYSFTMEDHQPLKVQAEAKGFISNAANVGTPADLEEESMRYPDLCLVPEAPKVDEKFVIENVYYDFNKADLKPESYPALDEVVRMLNTYPNMAIELGAHTDSKGSDTYNMKLSEARAQSVVKYLVEKGISAERLVAKGYGEAMPIAPNEVDGKDNPEGREKNRRTEFKVLKNE